MFVCDPIHMQSQKGVVQQGLLPVDCSLNVLTLSIELLQQHCLQVHVHLVDSFSLAMVGYQGDRGWFEVFFLCWMFWNSFEINLLNFYNNL